MLEQPPHRAAHRLWTYFIRLDQHEQLAQDLAELKPADLIDVQAFIYLSGRMEEEP